MINTNDQYRRVTQSWVHERAKAVVLVVDRSGITQESAGLLRSSGFFSRLAHAAHDPSVDPVKLFVIAVKIDLSANDAWREERGDDPETARDWVEHFAALQAEMKNRIQSEVALQLRQSMDDAESHDMLKSLTDGMSVHVVSAEEFRKLLTADDADPARIQDAAQSGIPDLRDELSRLVRKQEEVLRTRIVDASDQFVERVMRSLETIRLECSDRGRSKRAIKKLRRDLDRFLDDKSGPRRLLRSYQDSFRQFLKQDIQDHILQVAQEGCRQAETAIVRYLRNLGVAHWATLRAAVRRGGTFVTGSARKIDIPNEFAIRLEESLAIRWSKDILGSIRERSFEYNKQCMLCIEKVVNWGEEQETAGVGPVRIRALMAELQAGQPDTEAALNDALKERLRRGSRAATRRTPESHRGALRVFLQVRKAPGYGYEDTHIGLFRRTRSDMRERGQGYLLRRHEIECPDRRYARFEPRLFPAPRHGVREPCHFQENPIAERRRGTSAGVGDYPQDSRQ